ncbi:hypothetical protein BFL40_11740 [Pseudomonas costantinii]|uniref:Peptidase C58 YopT-type domain-containing protein n=1 Tax=Pseudomonas costantinii TaxID=168469 RepID=A0A1S2V480_9PSED|nr:hypothetical protein BFL40_11740 [Pseudomonas costantinii]
MPHGHTAEVSDHTTPSPSATSITSISQSSTSAVQAPPTNTLRRLLADQENLRDLAGQLRGIDTRVYGKPVTPEQISYRLNNSTLAPHQDSFYASTRATPQTLATIITDLGFKLPGTADAVSTLATELEQKASLHPLGNFGGGLSWPIPMSRIDQHSLLQFLYSNKTDVPGLPLPHGGSATLGYLLSGSSVTQSDLQDPVKALQKLLDSPKARALGQAMQTHLHGASSDTSIYEHVLTAIHFGLDPQSTVWRFRNKIGDFDLVHPGHWGQSPSTIVESLSRNLVANGKATADTAKLATHLLLALEAPQFLIKDIPKNVTIGSLAWANLSIAAAAIEAERPGTVSNMTFAEVMIHYENNKGRAPAPESAQSAALVDWAVANGVIIKSPGDSYTVQQLNTVRTEFNRRLNAQLSASQALDMEIPTRKDIALAKLKERFGDLGALFEEKVLSTDAYRGTASQTRLAGMHSLLDIAMMDWPDPAPFKSSDPRIPLEALNNDLTFGVQKEFDRQFGGAINEKKAAVKTTVKHMISQLPLEDRKNFEYGKVTFFQEGSHTLGLGFTDKTPGPNKPGLLVKTELNGKSQAYEINLNKGTIERTDLYRAKNQESRQANEVDTTKKFTPSYAAHDLAHERPANESLLNSFNSGRSRSIANAFLEHLELDDPAIKEQARGQTTLDKLQGGPKPLSEFLLNLIPFRSAIVNFQKGNYGEGAFDLTLDIFGFLTAGAATAGKLIKIGSAALSTGAKALRAAKVIGAATVGMLNPLSGLGDIAEGGIKLLGSAGGYLLSKGAEVVNKLKGATGSYDLLKAASKNHGVVATGTYKVAEQTVEGAAVFRESKWYAYDPINNRPYGSAIADFKPATIAGNGEINGNLLNWLTAVVAPNPRTPNLPRAFKDALDNAKVKDISAFNQGYATGKPDNIPGYYTTMKTSELKELAVIAGRSPEEIGTLAKLIQTRQVRESLESSRIFNQEVTSAGGKSTAMPQGFYLSQTDLPSNGECAALANTMALAIQHGSADQLIGNFFKASANALDPKVIAFRKQLNDMHKILSPDFHAGQPFSAMPYNDIIANLRNATTSTTLKISTQNHGLLAGVTINNHQKEWFFFDPNFGLAKFPDQASMERGLELTLNSGKSGGTLDPVAITGGVPEYHVSTFRDGDFLMSVPYQNPFALFNAPL